jgi:hypothetical protein
MIVSWLHKGRHCSMRWLELSIRCLIDLGYKGPIVARPHDARALLCGYQSGSSLEKLVRLLEIQPQKASGTRRWRKRYVAQESAAHLVIR